MVLYHNLLYNAIISVLLNNMPNYYWWTQNLIYINIKIQWHSSYFYYV